LQAPESPLMVTISKWAPRTSLAKCLVENAWQKLKNLSPWISEIADTVSSFDAYALPKNSVQSKSDAMTLELAGVEYKTLGILQQLHAGTTYP
jgi:hypothetical protein